MLTKLKQLLNSLDSIDALMFAVWGIVLVAVLAISNAIFLSNDPRAATVMVVNRLMNHGGTGVILRSSQSESVVLTNDHVCRAIKGGGAVRAKTGDYQVTAIVESKVSDLCLVYVSDDLYINTAVSKSAPKMYDEATISGHPALYPNVISRGHFSGRQIIQVMTGFKKCEDADYEDPMTGLICAFFGGLPVVKAYESVLVSATIMPGSSGSGVYNSADKLSGVVFAGAGDLGYAWIVPYEQLLQFLNSESLNLEKQFLSQEVSALKEDESKHLREVLNKCKTSTEQVIINICNIIKRDATWVQ